MKKYLLFLSAVLLFLGTAYAQVQIKEKPTKQLNEIGPAKPVDIPDPKKLESHAVLTVISPDVEVNAKLIEKGFTSLVDVAKCSRKDFVEKAKAAGIKEEIAISIHKKATKSIFEKKQKKIAPYHSDKTAGPQKYRDNKEKE